MEAGEWEGSRPGCDHLSALIPVNPFHPVKVLRILRAATSRVRYVHTRRFALTCALVLRKRLSVPPYSPFLFPISLRPLLSAIRKITTPATSIAVPSSEVRIEDTNELTIPMHAASTKSNGTMG